MSLPGGIIGAGRRRSPSGPVGYVTARHWRVQGMDSTSGSVIAIGEIQFDSITPSGGTVTVSSVGSGNVGPNAIDGNTATQWACFNSFGTRVNATWAYDFVTPITPTSFSIQASSAYPLDRFPGNGNLQFSDDGTNWTTYEAFSWGFGWTAEQTKTHNLTPGLF